MNRILASRYEFGQGVDPDEGLLRPRRRRSTPAPSASGATSASCSPTRSTCRTSRSPRSGYGHDAAAALAVGQLQPVLGQQEPVAARRPRRRLARRSRPPAAAPTASTRASPRPTPSRCGPTSRATTRSTPTGRSVSGYSMGGFGTYRLLARWPDLFARGFSVVGPPGSVDDQLAVAAQHAAARVERDGRRARQHRDRASRPSPTSTRRGLRFVDDLFLDRRPPDARHQRRVRAGAEFLGEHRVDRDPPHVTYVVDPTEDSAAAAAVADHAYWLSGLTRARRRRRTTGTVDARSEALRRRRRRVRRLEQRRRHPDGGAHGPMPYAEREQAWGQAPARAEGRPPRARGDEPRRRHGRRRARARLSCAPLLDVTSDGPLDAAPGLRAAGGEGARAAPGASESSGSRGSAVPASPRATADPWRPGAAPGPGLATCGGSP